MCIFVVDNYLIMKEKVILLGASGLIGSYLLPLLLNAEHIDKVHILLGKECNHLTPS